MSLPHSHARAELVASWKLLLQMAFRNVLRQRSRATVALIAISVGVAAMVVAGGFIHDVYIQFAESLIHSQYGHLQVHRNGYALRGIQRPTDYLIDDAGTVVQQIEHTGGIDIVLSRLRFTGLATVGGADVPIIGEGVEPDAENHLGSFVRLVSGRLLRNTDRTAVIIGEGLASALRVQSGDRMSVSVSVREGAVNNLEFDVVGVFKSYSKDFDQRAVRLPLSAAQELLDARAVNEIVVVLRDSADVAASEFELRRMFAPHGFEIRTWRDLADFYNKTVELFDKQYGFLQGVLLMMIALSVANAINTMLFERMPEFGTMLALGDRRQRVFLSVIAECAILGIIGSGIGVFVGIAVASVLSIIGLPMPPPPNTDLGYVAQIRIVPAVIVHAFLIGVVSAVIAGIFPSLRIARTAPVEALRRAV